LGKFFTIAAAVASLSAAPALANDSAVNAVYERIQASFNATAAEAAPILETVYAPGASYLPRHKEAGIDGREAILRGMTGFLGQLRKSGGQIETRFRVVERKRLGNVYVDNGYMRTTLRVSKDAPERVMYGKFTTVLAQQAAGHWAFVNDADSETSNTQFDNAKRVPGLKYDL
jgi:ketosteroid isomerase-like protein